MQVEDSPCKQSQGIVGGQIGAMEKARKSVKEEEVAGDFIFAECKEQETPRMKAESRVGVCSDLDLGDIPDLEECVKNEFWLKPQSMVKDEDELWLSGLLAPEC